MSKNNQHRLRTQLASMLFMASTAASAVASNDLYVDQSNPNCPGSGTDLDPFCTIQAALDASVDGDLILVAPRQYMENVIIEMRDVTVRANSPAIGQADNGSDIGALQFAN